jgi:Spy/CpxP family protein refolding chaperone
MKTRSKWLLAVLATTGIAGAALAQTSANPSSSAASPTNPPARHWRPRGPQAGGALLLALRQLDLSPTQQQSIRSILMSARQQLAAERKSAGPLNLVALANPADPNHAAAVQQLQTLAMDRIQEDEQVDQQIYALLSPTQQAALPGVLANLKARFAQHSGNPT